MEKNLYQRTAKVLEFFSAVVIVVRMGIRHFYWFRLSLGSHAAILMTRTSVMCFVENISLTKFSSFCLGSGSAGLSRTNIF